MSTGLSQFTDIVPENTVATMGHSPFLGFNVQRMDFFEVTECWTVLLTAETIEFFHWLSEEKWFVIPRAQASQAIHMSGRWQTSNILMVKRPSECLHFFKIAAADAEMLRDWMGVSTTKSEPGALIDNLCKLIYQPTPTYHKAV